MKSSDDVAIVGHDNVLFLFGGSNKYFDAYQLAENHAQQNAETWYAEMMSWKRLCERFDVEFVPLVIPNKASVLPDLFPLNLESSITPTLAALQNMMADQLLCPIVELHKTTKSRHVFRRNDSHLSEYGNIFFVSKVLEKFGINYDEILLQTSCLHVENHGDLGGRFSPKLHEAVSRLQYEESVSVSQIVCPIGKHTGQAYETVCESAPIKSKLLIFGNSFVDRPDGWSMAPILTRLFREVRFHWETGVYMDEIIEYAPDLVLFQTCERFLCEPPRKQPFKFAFGSKRGINCNSNCKQEKVMRLSAEHMYKLETAAPFSGEVFVLDSYIGRVEAGSNAFPLSQLAQHQYGAIQHGVTVVSDDRNSITALDINDYVGAFTGEDYLISELQEAVCAGKWTVYAMYNRDGVIQADIGVVLPVEMKGVEFEITCEGVSSSGAYYYEDVNFRQTHWFMPEGCVIGVRCMFDLTDVGEYIHFNIKFKDERWNHHECAFRTQVAYTNPELLKSLPDLKRIHRVASRNANEHSFINGGRSAYLALKNIASEKGVDLSSSELRVLDWGVGCGRVIKHFSELPTDQLFGIDIDQDNISWCQQNLKGNFIPVDILPPTSLHSNSFDLIYSCSVLSHLTEKDAELWLAEIKRILRKGGVALLSYNGTSNSAAYLSRRPEEFRKVLGEKLFDSDVNNELDGFIPNTDYYRASFASDEWWKSKFSNYFKHVDIELSVVNGFQHIAVLRA